MKYKYVTEPETRLYEEVRDGEKVMYANIECFRTGVFEHPWYGKLNIDKKYLSTILKNWKDNVFPTQVSFDRDHNPASGAMAWIPKYEDDAKALYIVSKSYKDPKGKERSCFVLMAKVELTDEGYSLIKSKKYKYFSSEINPNYRSYEVFYEQDKDTVKEEDRVEYGPVLVSGGLTNRPYIVNLEPISLSFSSDVSIADETEVGNSLQAHGSKDELMLFSNSFAGKSKKKDEMKEEQEEEEEYSKDKDKDDKGLEKDSEEEYSDDEDEDEDDSEDDEDVDSKDMSVDKKKAKKYSDTDGEEFLSEFIYSLDSDELEEYLLENYDFAEGDGYSPTSGMKSAAKRGLEMVKKYGRGGTAIGRGRASDIAAGRSLSIKVVARMVSFFARHGVNEGKNKKPNGEPTNHYIAWLLWGGNAGRSWSNKIWKSYQSKKKNQKSSLKGEYENSPSCQGSVSASDAVNSQNSNQTESRMNLSEILAQMAAKPATNDQIAVLEQYSTSAAGADKIVLDSLLSSKRDLALKEKEATLLEQKRKAKEDEVAALTDKVVQLSIISEQNKQLAYSQRVEVFCNDLDKAKHFPAVVSEIRTILCSIDAGQRDHKFNVVLSDKTDELDVFALVKRVLDALPEDARFSAEGEKFSASGSGSTDKVDKTETKTEQPVKDKYDLFYAKYSADFADEFSSVAELRAQASKWDSKIADDGELKLSPKYVKTQTND
jgi:hypothetical protein